MESFTVIDPKPTFAVIVLNRSQVGASGRSFGAGRGQLKRFARKRTPCCSCGRLRNRLDNLKRLRTVIFAGVSPATASSGSSRDSSACKSDRTALKSAVSNPSVNPFADRWRMLKRLRGTALIA